MGTSRVRFARDRLHTAGPLLTSEAASLPAASDWMQTVVFAGRRAASAQTWLWPILWAADRWPGNLPFGGWSDGRSDKSTIWWRSTANDCSRWRRTGTSTLRTHPLYWSRRP